MVANLQMKISIYTFVWKSLHFSLNFTEIDLQGFIQQSAKIGSDNGLVQYWQRW